MDEEENTLESDIVRLGFRSGQLGFQLATNADSLLLEKVNRKELRSIKFANRGPFLWLGGLPQNPRTRPTKNVASYGRAESNSVGVVAWPPRGRRLARFHDRSVELLRCVPGLPSH